MPAPAGNGLAMRAGLFLEALARDHEVWLVVVPVAAATPQPAVTPFVARRTVRAVVLPLAGMIDPLFALLSRVRGAGQRAAALARYPRPFLARFASPAAVAAAAGAFPGVRFEVVHVMRGYLAPFAGPHLEVGRPGAGPRVVLDLDEPDSHALATIAALGRRRGDPAGAARDDREAARHADLERTWLPRFDRVLVASAADRARVAGRAPAARVEVVPNAVRVPRAPARRPGAGDLDLLLVGSLGHVPNEDAARFLCRAVLPRLRAAMGRPVSVGIVGRAPGPAMRGLGAIPGVHVRGDVPRVAPYYARARLAVVPLRAGGGTRIKVLEAFAHRVPVVATPVGVEGLEVEDGRHLLVADGAAGLASACHRLLADPGLARRLETAAARLVGFRYALPVVARSIRQLYRSISAAP